ncbi:MAG: spore germination protein GerW family protein [Methanobrevibacter ruminantium]|uniref:GerW family sporulation protein n=1 Tax=Methanobrevibacter ruminantium TaxID=83816 RepID=UPI0026F012E5|nr:spore germination protein GerW family protein [Methanobrevibacter ruminantium]MDD6048301.1 spore germination protein GerW family protein [Methanobrevibacter ruminantium]
MIDEAPIKSTVEELRKLIHISNYVGEPIESEDKILIPVTKAAIGFGIGEQKAGQQITATGAGVSVEPVTMVVVSKGNTGAEGIRTINLSKGDNANKSLNELGLILTDILKDVIPSKNKDDKYINVDDVTEVEIQDGEIKEKTEDIVDEVEDGLDIEVDNDE